MELTNDRPAFVAHLVGIRRKPRQSAVGRDIEAGVTLLFESLTVRDGTVYVDTVPMHEALIADMHIIAVDLPFDAKPDGETRIFAGRNVDVQCDGFPPQRVGHGMLQPAFGGGSEANQMIARDVFLIADDIADFGSAFRERAGFVEDHRVDLGQALHVPPALDDDSVRGLPGSSMTARPSGRQRECRCRNRR